MARLNWRQILIHFFAFCLFLYSFQTFAFLYDIKLTEIIILSNSGNSKDAFIKSGKTVMDNINFVFWIVFSQLISLVIAFAISLTISIRRHWFWVNSLITLMLTYALYRFDLLGWPYYKKQMLSPGHMFDNLIVEFLLIGVIFLAAGLLLFFLRSVTKFIEHKNVPGD